MIRTRKELQQILGSTALKDCAVVKIPILDTGEIALAIEINAKVIESAWKIARSLFPSTGRWPIVTSCWNKKHDTLEAQILDADLFSRFYYEEAPNAGNVRPRALITASNNVDVEKFVRTLHRARAQTEGLAEMQQFELAETLATCGKSPANNEIENARIDGNPIRTHYQFDRWLMEWEIAQQCAVDPEQSRQDWFQPEQALILLLPITSSWEALAYLSFYGAYEGAEKYIALGKSWELRFGAVLVAHYGTMLQCWAARPPQDLHSAWYLAQEHDLIAPCTLSLPGISLRRHAAGLVNYNRWFLHERP